MDLPPDIVNYPPGAYQHADDIGIVADRVSVYFSHAAGVLVDPVVKAELEKMAKVTAWLVEADCHIAARQPTPPLPV